VIPKLFFYGGVVLAAQPAHARLRITMDHQAILGVVAAMNHTDGHTGDGNFTVKLCL